MSNGRVLITGASGLLGRHVARACVAAGWQVVGTHGRNAATVAGVPTRPLELPAGAAALIAEVRPDAVVHTAYARDAAMWRVIVEGSAEVARASALVGARLVHLSTDAIFAGRAAPYREEDSPDPVFAYGAAKAAAEAVVSALDPAAVIVRTSLLYTAPGDEPVDPNRALVAELIADPSRGALFADEFRCPLCVDDLAAAVTELLIVRARGPLHIVGPEPLSRYALGVALARSMKLDPSALRTGSAASLGRPSRLVLACDRASAALRTRIRTLEEALRT